MRPMPYDDFAELQQRLADAMNRALVLTEETRKLLEHTQIVASDARRVRRQTGLARALCATLRRLRRAAL